MARLSIRIPLNLQRELLKLSKEQSRSISEVVRESMRHYFAAQQIQRMREKLRPYAESAGFLTDEDVFKAVS